MRLLPVAAGVLIVLSAAAVAAWMQLSPTAGDGHAACRADGGGVAGADIGGAFTLTSHDGQILTDADLITGPTLIYFGYSFCPDFCPMDLAVMAEAAEILADGGRAVRMAFITVDPARDTPEALAPFVANIHPELIGLSGTEAQTSEAARAWRVYHAIVGDPDDPFYLVDHSTFTYLMAPGLGLLDFFRTGTDPDSMARRVACHIDTLS